MSAPSQLQVLIAEVLRDYPAASLNFDPLPSGVCFLRVTLGRREFVIEYHPTQGTGVSENFEDTPPFIGHDEAFDSLDEAVAHFKSLLTDAARTEADHPPKTLVLREENSPWKKSP